MVRVWPRLQCRGVMRCVTVLPPMHAISTLIVGQHRRLSLLASTFWLRLLLRPSYSSCTFCPMPSRIQKHVSTHIVDNQTCFSDPRLMTLKGTRDPSSFMRSGSCDLQMSTTSCSSGEVLRARSFFLLLGPSRNNRFMRIPWRRCLHMCYFSIPCYFTHSKISKSCILLWRLRSEAWSSNWIFRFNATLTRPLPTWWSSVSPPRSVCNLPTTNQGLWSCRAAPGSSSFAPGSE